MSARRSEPMILSEPSDRGVIGFWVDDRLPSPFRWDDADDGHRIRAWGEGTCPAGRHLFDVIEVTRDVLDEDGETTGVEFRARLTCVACGHIAAWDGVRHQERSMRILAVPLSAGGYRAQHIADRGLGLTSYAVYGPDNDRALGVITWGSGPRGRRYYQGRLKSWPQGQAVQGPSPIAVLRKIARAAKERAA